MAPDDAYLGRPDTAEPSDTAKPSNTPEPSDHTPTAQVALIAELRARVRQQEAVAELGQAALAATDLPAFLTLVVDIVRTTLGTAQAGLLQLVDGWLVTRFTGTEDPVEHLRYSPADLRGTTIETALRTGRPAHVADYGAQAVGAQNPIRARAGVTSAASVPIHLPGGMWGVLVVAHRERGGVGDQELLFLQQVATLVGTTAERARTDAHVQHQALHDALTGLPNRVMLHRATDEALSAGTGSPCALLLLDLDGFKDIHDTLGHAVGDTVLQVVATRLADAVGPRGVLARLGGDEFATLLREANWPSAVALAKLVLDAFEEPFTVGELSIPLTASIGIALSPTPDADTSSLLRRADVAMYRAKASGTGWAGYDAGRDAPQMRRLTVISELRDAISAGQLELHYQPLMSVMTGQVVSVEALVRWRHPQRGLVPPLEFIGLAEHSRLIGPLTTWVLEEALEQSGRWTAAGLAPVLIAVNLSAHCLGDPPTLRGLRRRLVDAREQLTVEVTESCLIDTGARRALHDLAAQGVGCSIDDFGTGYSSLAHLRELPVRELKIDRTFVSNLHGDPRDQAIVRSVVDLARALDLRVVAEGIETPHVAEVVRSIGVDVGQGFLWSRPLPGAELSTWRAEREGPAA